MSKNSSTIQVTLETEQKEELAIGVRDGDD